MGYRQDLEAAFQRVAALERQLKQAAEDVRGSDVVVQLTAQRDALAQELGALRDKAGDAAGEHAALEQEAKGLRQRVDRLEQQLAAVREVQAPSRAGLISLTEHNRRLPPSPRYTKARSAGVLCPTCLEQGQEVELREGANQWKEYGYGDAHCPVCLFDGWKKF
jgi:hypothetical protein